MDWLLIRGLNCDVVLLRELLKLFNNGLLKSFIEIWTKCYATATKTQKAIDFLLIWKIGLGFGLSIATRKKNPDRQLIKI